MYVCPPEGNETEVDGSLEIDAPTTEDEEHPPVRGETEAVGITPFGGRFRVRTHVMEMGFGQ